MPASAWLACAGAGLARGGLSGQGGDLDEVVGKNRVPAPDRGSVPAVQAGAVPAAPAVLVADPPLPAPSPPCPGAGTPAGPRPPRGRCEGGDAGRGCSAAA